ncbi:Vacuolar-sorting protein SNF8 [Armadillidium nasatum]|uniref:Vacuolar-sorting protein SNF8 n=1 Tax=Armadillidium nasatum TaxID=96803 RepID=A0A5N5TI17_9CRUS|nr:Vacuolar-sorting protein SNF8 [Armadillidium nasatum]
MLGVGDFYYELGVQIVELGVATSHQNGGVLPMHEFPNLAVLYRDDILRAVKKLQVLGSGMEVIESGRSKFICSVPGELSMDHTILLQEAEKIEPLSVRKASEHLKWSAERVARGLDHLLRVGIAWIDTQDSPPTYWFPAVFQRRFQANLQ